MRQGDVVRFKKDQETFKSFFRYEARLGLVFTIESALNSFDGDYQVFKLKDFDHNVSGQFLEKVEL